MLSITVRCSVLMLLMSAGGAGSPLRVTQSAFRPGEGGLPAGWSIWAVRPEIAPKTFIDTTHYRSEAGSLAISGNSNAAEYGGWEYLAPGIVAGKWYRFAAYYRAEGLHDETLQVVARLDW